MPKHILVADDEKENADLFVRAIEKLGQGKFSSEAVYDGQQCLDRIKSGKSIDLILLDLDMPKLSGADVIRYILAQGKKPLFRILVTTAWGQDWLTHWNLDTVAQLSLFQEIVVKGRQEKIGATVKERYERICEILQEPNP